MKLPLPAVALVTLMFLGTSLARAVACDSVTGWLEGMDEEYVWVAAVSDEALEDLSFVVEIDGRRIYLAFGGPADSRYETEGGGQYVRVGFDYHSALLLIEGEEYLVRSYDFAVGVNHPGISETLWVYEGTFYPSPYKEVGADEPEVRLRSSCWGEDEETGEEGLEIWLESSRDGRTYYEVDFSDGCGASVSAYARNVGFGLYRAFLPGFPPGGDEGELIAVYAEDGEAASIADLDLTLVAVAETTIVLADDGDGSEEQAKTAPN